MHWSEAKILDMRLEDVVCIFYEDEYGYELQHRKETKIEEKKSGQLEKKSVLEQRLLQNVTARIFFIAVYWEFVLVALLPSVPSTAETKGP